MKLSNYLSASAIDLDLSTKSKEQTLQQMVDLLEKCGKVLDKDSYLGSVMDREKLGSTGIGRGIAIPHGKSTAIKNIALAFGRCSDGIDFDALDDKPVNLVFMLAAPNNVGSVYLKVLAELSKLLKHKDFRQSLMDAGNPEEILEIFDKVC
jgi:fructose-specific phosphotransferase system IIA component